MASNEATPGVLTEEHKEENLAPPFKNLTRFNCRDEKLALSRKKWQIATIIMGQISPGILRYAIFLEPGDR